MLIQLSKKPAIDEVLRWSLWKIRNFLAANGPPAVDIIRQRRLLSVARLNTRRSYRPILYLRRWRLPGVGTATLSLSSGTVEAFLGEPSQPKTGGERPDRLAGRLNNAAIVLGTPLEAPGDSVVLERQQGESANVGENEMERRNDVEKQRANVFYWDFAQPRAECYSMIHYMYVRELPVLRPGVDLINSRRENRLDFSRFERKWSAKWNESLHSLAANHGAIIRVFCFDRTSIVLVELQSEARCIHQRPGFTGKRGTRSPGEQYSGMSASITWALPQMHPSGLSSHLFSTSFFTQICATRDSASTNSNKTTLYNSYCNYYCKILYLIWN